MSNPRSQRKAQTVQAYLATLIELYQVREHDFHSPVISDEVSGIPPQAEGSYWKSWENAYNQIRDTIKSDLEEKKGESAERKKFLEELRAYYKDGNNALKHARAVALTLFYLTNPGLKTNPYPPSLNRELNSSLGALSLNEVIESYNQKPWDFPLIVGQALAKVVERHPNLTKVNPHADKVKEENYNHEADLLLGKIQDFNKDIMREDQEIDSHLESYITQSKSFGTAIAKITKSSTQTYELNQAQLSGETFLALQHNRLEEQKKRDAALYKPKTTRAAMGPLPFVTSTRAWQQEDPAEFSEAKSVLMEARAILTKKKQSGLLSTSREQLRALESFAPKVDAILKKIADVEGGDKVKREELSGLLDGAKSQIATQKSRIERALEKEVDEEPLYAPKLDEEGHDIIHIKALKKITTKLAVVEKAFNEMPLRKAGESISELAKRIETLKSYQSQLSKLITQYQHNKETNTKPQLGEQLKGLEQAVSTQLTGTQEQMNEMPKAPRKTKEKTIIPIDRPSLSRDKEEMEDEPPRAVLKLKVPNETIKAAATKALKNLEEMIKKSLPKSDVNLQDNEDLQGALITAGRIIARRENSSDPDQIAHSLEKNLLYWGGPEDPKLQVRQTPSVKIDATRDEALFQGARQAASKAIVPVNQELAGYREYLIKQDTLAKLRAAEQERRAREGTKKGEISTGGGQPSSPRPTDNTGDEKEHHDRPVGRQSSGYMFAQELDSVDLDLEKTLQEGAEALVKEFLEEAKKIDQNKIKEAIDFAFDHPELEQDEDGTAKGIYKQFFPQLHQIAGSVSDIVEDYPGDETLQGRKDEIDTREEHLIEALEAEIENRHTNARQAAVDKLNAFTASVPAKTKSYLNKLAEADHLLWAENRPSKFANELRESEEIQDALETAEHYNANDTVIKLDETIDEAEAEVREVIAKHNEEISNAKKLVEAAIKKLDEIAKDPAAEVKIEQREHEDINHSSNNYLQQALDQQLGLADALRRIDKNKKIKDPYLKAYNKAKEALDKAIKAVNDEEALLKKINEGITKLTAFDTNTPPKALTDIKDETTDQTLPNLRAEEILDEHVKLGDTKQAVTLLRDKASERVKEAYQQLKDQEEECLEHLEGAINKRKVELLELSAEAKNSGDQLRKPSDQAISDKVKAFLNKNPAATMEQELKFNDQTRLEFVPNYQEVFSKLGALKPKQINAAVGKYLLDGKKELVERVQNEIIKHKQLKEVTDLLETIKDRPQLLDDKIMEEHFTDPRKSAQDLIDKRLRSFNVDDLVKKITPDLQEDYNQAREEAVAALADRITHLKKLGETIKQRKQALTSFKDSEISGHDYHSDQNPESNAKDYIDRKFETTRFIQRIPPVDAKVFEKEIKELKEQEKQAKATALGKFSTYEEILDKVVKAYQNSGAEVESMDAEALAKQADKRNIEADSADLKRFIRSQLKSAPALAATWPALHDNDLNNDKKYLEALTTYQEKLDQLVDKVSLALDKLKNKKTDTYSAVRLELSSKDSSRRFEDLHFDAALNPQSLTNITNNLNAVSSGPRSSKATISAVWIGNHEDDNEQDQRFKGEMIHLEFARLNPDPKIALVLNGNYSFAALDETINCCRAEGRPFMLGNKIVIRLDDKSVSRDENKQWSGDLDQLGTANLGILKGIIKESAEHELKELQRVHRHEAALRKGISSAKPEDTARVARIQASLDQCNNSSILQSLSMALNADFYTARSAQVPVTMETLASQMKSQGLRKRSPSAEARIQDSLARLVIDASSGPGFFSHGNKPPIESYISQVIKHTSRVETSFQERTIAGSVYVDKLRETLKAPQLYSHRTRVETTPGAPLIQGQEPNGDPEEKYRP